MVPRTSPLHRRAPSPHHSSNDVFDGQHQWLERGVWVRMVTPRSQKMSGQTGDDLIGQQHTTGIDPGRQFDPVGTQHGCPVFMFVGRIFGFEYPIVPCRTKDDSAQSSTSRARTSVPVWAYKHSTQSIHRRGSMRHKRG